MVKKAELKVGLLLRKKSWRSLDLRYKVNAIGKKQVLMECVKSIYDNVGYERVYHLWEICKDWEIYNDYFISEKQSLDRTNRKQNEYIGKIYKNLGDEKYKILDEFTNPNSNESYYIFENLENNKTSLMLTSYINGFIEDRSWKEVKEEEMNDKQALQYIMEQLKERDLIYIKDGKILVKEDL